MANLSLSETITESINNPVPKGTKRGPTGRPAPLKDPVLIRGIGVVERSQAEKYYPDMDVETVRKPVKEETTLYEDAFSAWKRRMEKVAHDRGMLLLYKTEGSSHGSTPEKVHAYLAIKMNGKTSPLNKIIGSFSNAENRQLNEGTLDEMVGAGMKLKELRKHMEKLGWYLARSNGPHDVYKHQKAQHHISLPRHNTEPAAPMMMKLKKQADSVLSESNEGTDHISMTVPLFIRCLEWAKETAKDDIELHKFVENIVAKGGVLETDDYASMIPSGDKVE